MKTMVILSLLLCVSFSAHAQYHRFYRGFVLPNTNMEGFLTEVNKNFFPLFAKAHGEGLVNYRPVLLNEDKKLGLPQEIVILTFKGEEVYKAYTETEIGKQIRAAHGPLFDSKLSKSLVPTPFEGKVAVESAYILAPAATELSKKFSAVLIHAEPFGAAAGTLAEVEKILLASRNEAVVALVADGYVVEYLFAASEGELETMRKARCSQYKGAFKTHKFIPLKKQKIGENDLSFSTGFDAQW